MVTITNVKLLTPSVSVGGVVKITFEAYADFVGFKFPFSNDSLTEPKIQFIGEDNSDG